MMMRWLFSPSTRGRRHAYTHTHILVLPSLPCARPYSWLVRASLFPSVALCVWQYVCVWKVHNLRFGSLLWIFVSFSILCTLLIYFLFYIIRCKKNKKKTMENNRFSLWTNISSLHFSGLLGVINLCVVVIVHFTSNRSVVFGYPYISTRHG